MILNNYWEWITQISKNLGLNQGGLSVDTAIKDLSGITKQLFVRAANSAQHLTAINRNLQFRGDLVVLLGKGTTEVTIDDYCLADDITDLITNKSTSVEVTSDENLKTIIVVTGTNLTDETIIIKEIGIKKTLTEDGSNHTYDTLLARKILDTPLEVPSNRHFTLTFEWIEQ